MNQLVASTRMDKQSLAIAALDDTTRECDYWQTRSPHERLAALELLRAIHYGYDPATARLQRLFEVARLGEG